MSKPDDMTPEERLRLLRRQGYKPIEEADLTPDQRAFAEGYKKGWNDAVEYHAATEAGLAVERDPDEPKLH